VSARLGIVRAILLFGVVALFFDLDLSQADFVAALDRTRRWCRPGTLSWLCTSAA
jgi:hypothetical protein